MLFAGPLLMILFRQKYPRWWFDWNLELTRFSSRVVVYGALLDDRYPSTDERQSLRLDIPYPDARTELNRWLPLVKWFLAIPHYIVLAFLGIAAFVCIVIAWFAILFTGRFPRDLFGFVVGVGRWAVRVEAYAFLLDDRPLPALLAEPVVGDTREQGIGDRLRWRGRREDEIGRASQERLDLGEVGEHLRQLGALAAIGVAGASAESLDEHRSRGGQQDPVVERQVGLLLGAARKEQQAIGPTSQEIGDRVGAPAPSTVGSRLAEAIVLGVEGRIAAAPQLRHQGRLPRPGHAGQQHPHHRAA